MTSVPAFDMDNTSETNNGGQTTFSGCQTPGYEPVAICGVGLHLPRGGRVATLLPEQHFKDANGTQERSNQSVYRNDGESDERKTSHALGSMESRSTGGDDATQQSLVEVVYKALEDGGETQYRGREARVGLFVSAVAQIDHRATDDDGDDENRGMLSLVSEKYDLHGSRSIHKGSAAAVAFCGIQDALAAMHNNDARSAVVAHVDMTDGVQSALAVYLKPLSEAYLGGDPVRAVLKKSDAANGYRPEGLIADETASDLPSIVKAILSFENTPALAGPKSTSSSSSSSSSFDCMTVDCGSTFILYSPCSANSQFSSASSESGSKHWHDAPTESLELSASSLASGQFPLFGLPRRGAETSIELQLQEIWAQVLGVPMKAIGHDTSFFQLGGSSLQALHLVAAARVRGITITVEDIFRDPYLGAIAEKAAQATDASTAEFSHVAPFSLLSEQARKSVNDGSIRDACRLLDNGSFEDAYPGTAFQEEVMEMSKESPKDYTVKYVYQLREALDIDRFERAWEQVVTLCPNLRTRIVRLNGETTQVVVKEPPTLGVVRNTDLESVVSSLEVVDMTYGSSLCRPKLIHVDDDNCYFALAVHPAIHDTWTMRIVHAILDSAYAGYDTLQPESYARFARYAAGINTEAAKAFWSQQLRGARPTVFPLLDDAASVVRSPDRERQFMRKMLRLPRVYNPTIAKATILRAAWSIVLARYSGTNDICFGLTSTGRYASVAGLEMMPGSTVATVPVRVQMRDDKLVSDFLQDLQTQAVDMIPFEHFGLKKIAQLNAGAERVCNFTSLLAIQTVQQVDALARGHVLYGYEYGNEWQKDMTNTYYGCPLTVQINLYTQSTELLVAHDPAVLSHDRILEFTRHFEHVVRQLIKATHRSRQLGDISLEDDGGEMLSVNSKPELLLFSAHNSPSLKEQVKLHSEFLPLETVSAADVAYTRALRREFMAIRAFSILHNGRLTNMSAHRKAPEHSSKITMVFSGQGAQWAGMGRELICEDREFVDDIKRMDRALQKLKNPPTWSIKGELEKAADDQASRINSAQFAQPLSIALQIALFRRFQRLNVVPDTVIGHSSGEIAAAYAAGLLTLEDAIAVAYHYGRTAGK